MIMPSRSVKQLHPYAKPPKTTVMLKKKSKARDNSFTTSNKPLVEKLLAEITGKYTIAQIKDSCYLARLEKKSMI